MPGELSAMEKLLSAIIQLLKSIFGKDEAHEGAGRFSLVTSTLKGSHSPVIASEAWQSLPGTYVGLVLRSPRGLTPLAMTVK